MAPGQPARTTKSPRSAATGASAAWRSSNQGGSAKSRGHRVAHRAVDFGSKSMAFLHGLSEDLARLTSDAAFLSSRGPCFVNGEEYSSQASIAFLSLSGRLGREKEATMYRFLPRVLDLFLSGCPMVAETFLITRHVLFILEEDVHSLDDGIRREWAASVARVLDKADEHLKTDPSGGQLIGPDVLKRMRSSVRKLDPSLKAPPAAGDADRTTP